MFSVRVLEPSTISLTHHQVDAISGQSLWHQLPQRGTSTASDISYTPSEASPSVGVAWVHFQPVASSLMLPPTFALSPVLSTILSPLNKRKMNNKKQMMKSECDLWPEVLGSSPFGHYNNSQESKSFWQFSFVMKLFGWMRWDCSGGHNAMSDCLFV